MKNKIIWIISPILLIIIIFIIAFFNIHITSVQVEGNNVYTRNEIISEQMSGKYAYNTIYMFIHQHIFGSKDMPFAQEIDAKLVNFHCIKFTVYEKTISSCVQMMNQYAYIDMNGVVLKCMQQKLDGVTVITGVDLKSFTVGEKIETKDDSIFDMIVNVSQLIKHYNLDVNTVNTDNNEITLYTDNVTVYLGKKEFYDDDIAALSSVLKKIKKKKLSGTIDMREYTSGDRIILKPSAKSSKKGSTDTEKTTKKNV